MAIDLVHMVGHFNGAELFIKAGPMISIFGITAVPPLSPMEWAPEWQIDRYTPAWRKAGVDRENDWAFAITNYGGLSILRPDNSVKEFDRATSTWGQTDINLAEWTERVLREGDAFLREE